MCYDNKEMRDLMKSVREITTYKWIIKKSEFICTLIPCNDELQLIILLKNIKKNIMMLLITVLLIIVWYKNVPIDNGEPSGTAGLPMLDVLEKNKLTNYHCYCYKIFWRD